MREIISIILLFMLFNVGCSDSKNPTGSDNNENTTIDIQGVVMGPGNTSGKVLPIEGTNQQLSNKELEVQRSDTNPELIKKDEDVLEVPGSFQKAEETSLSNESPLEDVIVSFYELDDYISNQESAQLIASTTTDTDGRYTITDLEEGIDMVIVAESVPRQTLMVMNVDQQSTGDVNSATSIVSEYWAGELADGTDFNQSEYDELLDTANELLADMPTDELLSILSELVPERFGDGFPGNLSSEAKRFVNTLTGLVFAACEDIVFEKSSGKPTNYVLINGIPAEFIEEPLGWFYYNDNISEENRFGVYIERISDNQAEILIPIHPDNYIDGGSVMIEIYDENQSIICPGISFEIEPLAKASGTFEQMISKLEVTFQKMAQEFGYSSNDLISVDVTELPDEVKAIAAGIQTIDGSNNPNSIRNILSGDAPILEGEPLNDDVLELFDALFHESGLSEKVISANELFNSQAKSNSTGSVGNCVVLPENISTPGELNCWMGVQAWFENANQGLSREIRDATGAVLGIGGVVALGTGLGAPLAAALGMSATAVTMMQIFIDNNDNTLPSQLLGFEIWGNPTIYENEDDDTEGVWSADLSAQSNGWTLDWPTTLGNIPGLGKAAGILNKTKIPNVVEFLIDNFQREANNIWKADSGPINISPQMLQVTIDVNRDEDYFNWELNTKSQETNVDPFSFTQDKQGYTPEAVGTADLRIETKGGDVFKGQNAFNEVDLEVVGINITLVEFVADSDTTYVSPIYIGVDEELTLEAAVENARNKEVAWSVSPEESGLSLTDWHVEPATGIKDVIAKDPGRYTVEVESTADTGPRADKNPRRFDWVTIVVGGLNVSNPGCLQPGETSQLKASIGGESVDFSELEWDINGPGSIDSEGVFTANETGTVEIDFYLSDNSEITYSINFRIDETCRTFTLSSAEFEISGTCVYFDESGGASNSTGIYFGTRLDDISGSITLHTLLKETMPEDEAWTVSDPEWQISSAVNIKTSTTFPWSNWVHLANEPPGPFSITIEHDVINNGRTLSGSFKGEYEFVDYSDDESIHRIETVEGSFRGATRSVPSECF